MGPLTGLLVTLAFGAPAPAVREAPIAANSAAASDSVPRARLWELLTKGVTEAEPRPTSPRYLALERPGFRGFDLLVAWALPGLSPNDEKMLRAVESTLGGDDGWLAARIVKTRKADQVSVWLERREGGAWFGIEVSGSAKTATKDLELMVLETLGVLEAHAPPPADDTGGAAEGATDELTPAVVGKTVRRWLSPLSRAVVEVQPPDAPNVARLTKVPVRHVVERGDTLTAIAHRHGLDLDALVKLNKIDPEAPIHPGEELRVTDKQARRPKLYVVKKGDTLAKVARRYGLSEAALMDMNRLAERRVQTGQKLVLPP
jgi:LysM repeat protein